MSGLEREAGLGGIKACNTNTCVVELHTWIMVAPLGAGPVMSPILVDLVKISGPTMLMKPVLKDHWDAL